MSAPAVIFARARSRILTLVATIAVLVCCGLAIPRAEANEFPPYGDSGTAQARDNCPAKQYLVGLFVKSGAWMDQMGIICAPVDINANTGAPTFGPPRGGRGGGPPVNVTCSPNEIMTSVSFLMTPNNKQVRMLRFSCAALKTSSRHTIDIGNTSQGGPSTVRQDCSPGQYISGVVVNYGLAVNALGIVCTQQPAFAPPPAGTTAAGTDATTFTPKGDSGSSQATDTCPNRQYLVGLSVKVGDWMDRMGIICAPVDSTGSTGAPSFGAPRGGTGGGPPANVTCAPNEIMTGVGLLLTPENKQVRMLRFNCVSEKTGAHHDLDIGNTTHGSPSNVRQDCPAGQAISGVVVNYGIHVNAVALVCSVKPVVKAAANDGNNNAGNGSSGTGSQGSGAGQSKVSPFANKILDYARNHLNTKIGRGECTDLVVAALAYAGARPGDTSSPTGYYVWGSRVNFPTDAPQPGDIIQLVNVKLSFNNGSSSGTWETTTQHTAIIESADGKLLHVIGQNAPPGSPVSRQDINLNWTLDRGSYVIYRAQ